VSIASYPIARGALEDYDELSSLAGPAFTAPVGDAVVDIDIGSHGVALRAESTSVQFQEIRHTLRYLLNQSNVCCHASLAATSS
jgi:hypothetical protein